MAKSNTKGLATVLSFEKKIRFNLMDFDDAPEKTQNLLKGFDSKSSQLKTLSLF